MDASVGVSTAPGDDREGVTLQRTSVSLGSGVAYLLGICSDEQNKHDDKPLISQRHQCLRLSVLRETQQRGWNLARAVRNARVVIRMVSIEEAGSPVFGDLRYQCLLPRSTTARALIGKLYPI